MELSTFATEEVKKLKIETACADVIFDTTEDNQVRVEAENLSDGIYTCQLRGDRLVVFYELPEKIAVCRNHIDTRITLYFPKGFVFENVKMETGAGNIFMERFPVSCESMEIKIGAGKCRADQLSVEKKLYVNVGAGKAKLYTAKAGTLSIDCGVGDCIYEGSVNGDVDVNCGVGKCELKLDNQENDFNYDISCGLGKVSVNDRKIKLIGSEKRSMGGDVLGTVRLQCGVGKIELMTDVL